jgi:uncharacterized flavoprotein (TIGR03862 family)
VSSEGRFNSAAIVGAGPAGLMAAETLAAAGLRVTVYEQMPSVGRKFLLAGRGGLNLTHSEPFDAFVARYGAAAPVLREAIEVFSPARLRAWAEALGQETFVGSSGRVFPKAMKASPLLRAWLRRLAENGVTFRLRHRWTGWSDGSLRFEGPDGELSVSADVVVLALGGASWPHLGSNGQWAPLLKEAGVAVAPLVPANCGFVVNWSETFRSRFEGQPLKGIALRVGDRSVRGEALVTRSGIEGGAVYAISAALRDATMRDGGATLEIALRPDLDDADLAARLARPRGKQSLSTWLRKMLNLSPVAIALLHEACAMSGGTLASLDVAALAKLVNHLPLRIEHAEKIDRAISTAGGIAFGDLDQNFMLKKMPGVFVAGEMLDWEAPTGGYLLQACFATGAAAGKGAAMWLRDMIEESR